MITVNKEEAIALREKYGGAVCIAITNKHKKSNRKNYYVEETNRVLYFLERFRKKRMKRGARGG